MTFGLVQFIQLCNVSVMLKAFDMNGCHTEHHMLSFLEQLLILAVVHAWVCHVTNHYSISFVLLSGFMFFLLVIGTYHLLVPLDLSSKVDEILRTL